MLWGCCSPCTARHHTQRIHTAHFAWQCEQAVHLAAANDVDSLWHASDLLTHHRSSTGLHSGVLLQKLTACHTECMSGFSMVDRFIFGERRLPSTVANHDSAHPEAPPPACAGRPRYCAAAAPGLAAAGGSACCGAECLRRRSAALRAPSCGDCRCRCAHPGARGGARHLAVEGVETTVGKPHRKTAQHQSICSGCIRVIWSVAAQQAQQARAAAVWLYCSMEPLCAAGLAQVYQACLKVVSHGTRQARCTRHIREAERNNRLMFMR